MLTQDLLTQLQISLTLAQCTKVEIEPFTGNMKMYFPPEVLDDYSNRLLKQEKITLAKPRDTTKNTKVMTTLGPIVELIPNR